MDLNLRSLFNKLKLNLIKKNRNYVNGHLKKIPNLMKMFAKLENKLNRDDKS